MELFIDTHSELITIGIKYEDKIIKKEKMSDRSHSVFLLPMIDELLKENGLSINDLKTIIVVNGPGSFTGIRIGLTVAKTLSYALKIDIKTISSLTAFLVSNEGDEKNASIIEDNKGYYIGTLNKEYYSENLDNSLSIIKNELNLDKIFNYAKKIDVENVHFVNANYIKKIGVENDRM